MSRYGFVFLALLIGGSSAQETSATPLPDAPSQTQQETEAERKAKLHAEGELELQKQEQQRILTVVPNFNTVISGKSVRLSPGQKTRLAVKATLDPFNVVGAFLLGGYNELGDQYRGYGWGPAGYFKRVGANYLDTVDGTMLAGAVYPILLRQDPRYFRKGTGSIKGRVMHAFAAPFVCLGDNGRRQVNASNILGNYTAGAISLAYYPEENRNAGLVLRGGTLVLVEGSLGNLGLEFSPDVAAWWQRRKAAARK